MVKLSSLNTFGTTEERIELRIGHAEWAIVNAIEVRHIAYRVRRFLRMKNDEIHTSWKIEHEAAPSQMREAWGNRRGHDQTVSAAYGCTAWVYAEDGIM